MAKNKMLESLNMEPSDNEGFKIRYCLKTKNTDARNIYDDYKHSYKEEVFTKWEGDDGAAKRYKELADMRHTEVA